MSYKCGVCGQDVEKDLLKFVEHTEGHIIEEIRSKHPDWAEEDGLCQKCLDYYKSQLKK